jgi:hypothetical protein
VLRILSATETLHGDDVLPGFALELRAIFDGTTSGTPT